MEPILETLGQLFIVLGQLLVQVLALGVQWILLIAWIAWWLLAVDWRKAFPVIRSGGWAPLVLLTIVVALAWSRLQPAGNSLLPNFWWQLAWTACLVVLALFCGWLQGVLDWRPAEINLDPPAAGHADAHGHAAHH